MDQIVCEVMCKNIPVEDKFINFRGRILRIGALLTLKGEEASIDA